MRPKVVSVDMFRTLVDLAAVENTIWPAVLGDSYSSQLAADCAAHARSTLFDYLSPARFMTCKQVFAACFGDVFAARHIEADPHEAARLWAAQHCLSPAFPDSAGFLRTVGRGHLLCLASDTDEDMLGPLKEMYPFDHVFTSESLVCYKAYGDGRFFNAIVDHYGVDPAVVVHVGDGLNEILGAKNAGLTACWLNRAGSCWTHQVKPDFEVRSLSEAALVLDLE
jgi:FMN phosphatase YigB (HAD superfamily)